MLHRGRRLTMADRVYIARFLAQQDFVSPQGRGRREASAWAERSVGVSEGGGERESEATWQWQVYGRTAHTRAAGGHLEVVSARYMRLTDTHVNLII